MDTNDEEKGLTYIIRSNTTSYGGFEGVGYISGTTLTITRTNTGILKIGDVVTGGKTITNLGTYSTLTGSGTLTISAAATSSNLTGSITALGLLTVTAVSAGTTLVAGQELGVDGLPDNTQIVGLSYYSSVTVLVDAIPQPFNTVSSNTVTVGSYTGDNAFQNGEYAVSASSAPAAFPVWKMFYGAVANYGVAGKTSNLNDFWHCQYTGGGAGYTTNPYIAGSYQGGGLPQYYYTTTIQGVVGDIAGEWVQIKLPYQLQLTNYALHPRKDEGANKGWLSGYAGTTRYPKKFYVVGSNDGVTWYPVDYEFLSAAPSSNLAPLTYNPTTTTTAYYYFRLIINQMNSTCDVVHFSDWTLKGNYAKTPLPVYTLTKTPTEAIPSSFIYIKDKYTIPNGSIIATNDSTIQLFGLPSRYDKFYCEVISFMVSGSSDDIKANVVELRQEGISLMDGKDGRQGTFKSLAFRNMMTDNQSTYNFICDNFNNKYIRFQLCDEYGTLLLDNLNGNYSRPWILVLKIRPMR